MSATTPRPCPWCAASATKSTPHCDHCHWRKCHACNQPYTDSTKPAKENR